MRGILRSVLPFLVGAPALALVQWAMPEAWVLIAISVGVNVVLAVSLNVVNGFTGQFSLGHAGFMAVGAYTAAKITLALADVKLAFLPAAVSDQVVFAVALGAGMGTAALAGFLVGMPSLRLRGDYLAIVTLGFGEIIRVVIENTRALGGATGLSGLRYAGTLEPTWHATPRPQRSRTRSEPWPTRPPPPCCAPPCA